MNLKSLNLKWALAFAGAAAVGVVGVVLVLTLMRGGDEQATAQSDSATATPLATLPPGTAQATVLPGATEPPVSSYHVHIPTVPPGLTLAEKRPCPEGWRRMSDDKANYSFCLPPGWGMVDHETGQARVDTIMHWESAAILSPEAFPYPYAGSYEKGIRDLIRDSEKNIVWIQLLPFWADQENSLHMTCLAEPSGLAGALPSASCENHFDIPAKTVSAIPDPAGKWKRLFVVVPLPTTEGQPSLDSSGLPTPEGGYVFGLGIIVEGSNGALAYYHDVIMQILGTLEGQP